MLWTKKQVPPWVPGLDPQFRVFLFTSDKAGTNLKRMRMKQPELLQGGGLSIHRLCQAHRAFTGFSKTICLVPGRLLGALARFCVSLGTAGGLKRMRWYGAWRPFWATWESQGDSGFIVIAPGRSTVLRGWSGTGPFQGIG